MEVELAALGAEVADEAELRLVEDKELFEGVEDGVLVEEVELVVLAGVVSSGMKVPPEVHVPERVVKVGYTICAEPAL